MEKNEKARANPAALAKLDGYKRGLVNSLTSNLQRFGFDKVTKVETLREIIEEIAEQGETSEKTDKTSPRATDLEKTQIDQEPQGTPPKIEICQNQDKVP